VPSSLAHISHVRISWSSQWAHFWGGILLNTLQASSMLPHFAYMSTKLLPTKTSNSQPVWMSCLWTSLPSSNVRKAAHALITWIKVNLLGLTPCCRICWKSYITVSSCPSFTCFVSFRLHANTLNCTIPGAFAAISAATHGEFHQSSAQSASHVFLCLKSGYLSFVDNQKSRSSWSPCILHIPGINDIIRKEKAALTFSVSILHWPTFSSLQLLLHKCKRPEKKFCTV